MAIDNTAMAAVFGTVLALSPEQVATLKTGFDGWALGGATPAHASKLLSDNTALSVQMLSMMADWQAGNPAGGPLGNGLYPLLAADGTTYLVPCPALIAQGANPTVIRGTVANAAALPSSDTVKGDMWVTANDGHIHVRNAANDAWIDLGQMLAKTITIGTVTTLAAGASATATLTPSGSGYLLDLGIPQGGTAGETAAALMERTARYGPNWTVAQAGAFISGARELDFMAGYYRQGVTTSVLLSHPNLTFARTGAVYTRNVADQLVLAASGAPRTTDRGLYVGPARTNLLLQSSALATSPWGPASGPAATPDVIAAPDGATTADRVSATVAASRVQQTVTVVAATQYVLSVYVKKDTSTAIRVRALSGSAGTLAVADFTWTGTAPVVSGSPTGTWTIQAMANGWYRLSAPLTTTDTSVLVSLFPDTAGTANSVYAWGVQLEEASYAGGLIPTTTTSAAVAQDVVTIDQAMTGPFSILLDQEMVAADATTGLIQGLFEWRSDSSNRLSINRSGSGQVRASVIIAGVVTTALNHPTVVNSAGRHQVALSWDGTTLSLTYDGVTATSVATAMPAFTTMRLAQNPTSGGGAQLPLNGWLRRFLYLPAARDVVALSSL